MLDSLELFLYFKPGEELDEGQPVTAKQLRELAASLGSRLQRAAEILETLTTEGWTNEMLLYSIVLYPKADLSMDEAKDLLRSKGIDPEQVCLHEADWMEENETSERPDTILVA
jgi:hypothetical protein